MGVFLGLRSLLSPCKADQLLDNANPPYVSSKSESNASTCIWPPLGQCDEKFAFNANFFSKRLMKHELLDGAVGKYLYGGFLFHHRNTFYRTLGGTGGDIGVSFYYW